MSASVKVMKAWFDSSFVVGPVISIKMLDLELARSLIESGGESGDWPRKCEHAIS